MMLLVTMVQVQLGVFAGAVAAALLGLLGYRLRCALGLVKPLPPEDETQKQH
jgi:hypothetical protein